MKKIYKRDFGGHGREVQEGGDTCIHIANSCCIAETQHCKAITFHLRKKCMLMASTPKKVTLTCDFLFNAWTLFKLIKAGVSDH